MEFEAAAIEIVLKKVTTLILFGIYRPPYYSNVQEFFKSFYYVLSKHLKIKIKLCLVVGDLNIDWLKTNSDTDR